MNDISRRSAIALMGGAALVPSGSLAAAAGGDAALADLAAAWIDGAAQLGPVAATRWGDHRLDAEVDDLSGAGRSRATRFARRVLVELLGTQTAGLTPPSQIDAAMLSNRLRLNLWRHEVLADWAWDPLLYNDLAGEALYAVMARDFAPLPARLASVTARMEKIPGLLAQARANLIPGRVPAIHAETAAKQNRGALAIVRDLVTPNAGQLAGAARDRLDAATLALTKAIDVHQAWLEQTLIPAAKGDFRLGADLYDTRLRFALQSPLGRAEIRSRAEAAVIATRKEMYALARTVLAGRPGAPAAPDAPDPGQEQAVIQAALDLAAADHASRGDLVSAAKAALEDATAFVRQKDLITLPTSPIAVIPMPPLRQGVAVAWCDPPGPMEKGLATLFAVSPVPDDWTAPRAESFLREYNRRALRDLATHEAMPGRYVQSAHSSDFPSLLRSLLPNASFVEGWGAYAESMMAEQGFMGADPLYRLVVLKSKLRAITDAILDQAVHVDGLAQADAMKLMTRTAFQEESEAAGKWVRACVTSAQLPACFVGSEEHWSLRRKAEQAWGAGFTLKRYHDTVLSFGSPPPRFVQAAMFGEPVG
jgi:uncharacterized protein (DUF885 family)